MKKHNFISFVFLLFFFATTIVAQTNTSSTLESKTSLDLDLNNSKDNLMAFLKMRASLEESEEVIYYATGVIYGFIEGQRDKALMNFEMYNIARLVSTGNDSYELLTREVGLYKDIKTGEILETFVNPYTEERVDVLHVWNDPVNQKFALESQYGTWGINHTSLGKDRICMNADIFLIYPSPLTVEEYPRNSQADIYEAAELFQFYFSREDMNNPALNSIPAEISWTRIGPWLPWMNMGQKDGHMVYQCTGYKIMGDAYDSMPEDFRNYITKHNPEFRHAPNEYTKPNETSWTYFKKMNSSSKEEDQVIQEKENEAYQEKIDEQEKIKFKQSESDKIWKTKPSQSKLILTPMKKQTTDEE